MMNIGALIPVRLGSERLPAKHLQTLSGRPMLLHLLDRAFASRHLRPENVVVCTTCDSADDLLVPVVESAGARVFRGSRDDIIDRFVRAIDRFGFDVVGQIDGDDPCTDPFYLDLCFDTLLQDSSLDIVLGRGLPLGLASKAIRRSAFEVVYRAYRTQKNDTGFIWYFTKTGLCRVGWVDPVSPDHVHSTARLTLDYSEDLAFFRAVFDRLYKPGQVFGIADIIALLRREPQLLDINAGLAARYLERTQELARLEYQSSNGHNVFVEVAD